MLSYFSPGFEKWSRGNFMMLIVIGVVGILGGIAWFLLQCAKMLSVTQRLEETDMSIEIRVGDLFAMKGALIISTNSTFETDMQFRDDISDYLISPESLQGKFTKKYYEKVAYLDADLEKALARESFSPVENPIGKAKRYEIGTVASVRPQDQPVYLV